MKALVYTNVEELTYMDVEDPQPTDNEVLVEVRAAGICGSDIHAWKGHDERRPAPLILGHEIAGILTTDQRVTVNPLVTCMQCANCMSRRTNLCPQRQILSMSPRQGGFTKYVTVPERNLVAIPENITYEQAALAEPIAVGWHAIHMALDLNTRPIQESKLLILGGGAIGLACALVSAHFGATQIWIAETNQSRHCVLSQAGNFNVFSPVFNRSSLESDFDIIIDAFGGTTTQIMASQLVCPGGAIINVGLAGGEVGLDVRKMTLQDIRFAGSYTYTHDDFINTTNALFAGELGKLDWFETHSLSYGAGLFAKINNGEVNVPKVILVPDE